MPIRADLRPLYKTPEAIASRRRALERAGGRFDENGQYVGFARCVQCAAPDREQVLRVGGAWGYDAQHWFSNKATPLAHNPPYRFNGRYQLRQPRIVLTVAHLDHNPRHNQDENRAALCQWCHLNYDKLHHKETRSVRKDAARPLLAGVV
jgi:hypothetical protein